MAGEIIARHGCAAQWKSFGAGSIPQALATKLGFGRRTVSRLMRSVSWTVKALVNVGSQAVVDATEPLTTANLCEAFVQMMPRDERTDLQIDARFFEDPRDLRVIE